MVQLIKKEELKWVLKEDGGILHLIQNMRLAQIAEEQVKKIAHWTGNAIHVGLGRIKNKSSEDND